MSGAILNVGQQPELLTTRGLVLKHAGYRVMDITDSLRAIEIAEGGGVDLVLFCHTIAATTLKQLVNAMNLVSDPVQLAYVLRSDYDEAPHRLHPIPNDAPHLISAIHDLLEPSAPGTVHLMA